MVEIVYGNLLDVTDGVILHQVNCQARMGSGVAKQIKEKYPIVYNKYMEYCVAHPNRFEILGTAQKVQINDNLSIYNVFGQLFYGYDGACYTQYVSLEEALKQIASETPIDVVISLPYKLGCGLAGGDWGIVEESILKIFKNHSVKIYKLDN